MNEAEAIVWEVDVEAGRVRPVDSGPDAAGEWWSLDFTLRERRALGGVDT